MITMANLTKSNMIRGMSCTSEDMAGVKVPLLRESGRKGTSPTPPSSCSLFASHWSDVQFGWMEDVKWMRCYGRRALSTSIIMQLFLQLESLIIIVISNMMMVIMLRSWLGILAAWQFEAQLLSHFAVTIALGLPSTFILSSSSPSSLSFLSFPPFKLNFHHLIMYQYLFIF